MKKLHEVAKDLGLSNQALLSLLRSFDYKATTSSAILSDDIIEKCKKQLEKSKETLKIEDKERKKIRTTAHRTFYESKKKKKERDTKFTNLRVRQTVSKIKMGERTKKYASKIDTPITKTETQQKLMLTPLSSVNELAFLLKVEPSELLKKCLEIGVLATLNKKLDFETATLICSEYRFETELKIEYSEEQKEKEKLADYKSPIVTVMGHVDHGKTALLDAIRHTNMIAKEAGGITQSIGAYRISVPTKDGEKFITFIDTPGHKAFTAMRGRGAKITDIVVLVVAADEGVMPQTIEAINHAKDAGVPIIVAINKIDIPNIIPGKIESQLMEHNIVTEKHGGQTLCCYLSAKTKEGTSELLDTIIMQAELLELRTSINSMPTGFIIESKMEKMGPVASVIVEKGILKLGQPIIADKIAGKVRILLNEFGERIQSAEPSQPVRIVGFSELPEVGSTFVVEENEKKTRELAKERKSVERVMGIERTTLTLEKLQKELLAGEIKELKLIIKSDSAGANEALADSIEQMHCHGESKVVVIHKGIGAINETDVLLAATSNAIIIGYNTASDANAIKLLKEKKVEVRYYQIIYEIIEDIEKALKGLLPPKYEEQKLGKAEIRQVFKISDLGFIAGCIVLQGKIIRNKNVRLIREGNVICESKIASLRRFKDQVKEVDNGLECGIGLETNVKIIQGDLLEVFEIVQVPD